MSTIDEILDFWFAPVMAEKWFKQDSDLDRQVRERLGALHENAAAGAFDNWRESAKGCIALVVLLDQVPRNIFRGDPRTYATDEAARAVARHALDRGFDGEMTQAQRRMLYIPLEHSEALGDQELSVRLTSHLDEDPNWHKWAAHHRGIIDRFGRFPHRNGILGRENTAEETVFLADPEPAF